MIKKIACLGLCVFLPSTIALADNPFDDSSVVVNNGTSLVDSANAAKVDTTESNGNKTTTSASQTSQYTVVLGDCLSAIARNLLGDECRWPEIVELNKDRYPSLISNPHMIEVGWVLTIPGGSSSSSSGSTVASDSTGSTTGSSSTGNTSSSTPSTLGHTQAKEFYELGDRAYNEWQEYNESCARAEWIRKVGAIVKNTNTFGMKKSLIIAQIINESGWMSTHASSLSNFNNVLGINTDMGRIKPSMQTSTWSKKKTSGNNNVTQWSSDGSHIVGTYESMRHYDSIEECIEDYAEVMSLYHPECKGNNNIEAYRSFLEGYTPNPNASTTDKYKNIIKKYNLERFDE